MTSSLVDAGHRRSDQGAVWSLIAEKSARFGAASDTSAMSAIFDKVGTSLDEFVAAFPPVEHQVGAVFLINGQPAGLELFDAASTWRKLSPKLVRSYAVDALDRRDGERVQAVNGDLPNAFASAVAEHQVGAVFLIDGKPAGLELFDAPSTWRKLSPKLVRSYAVDALD